MFSGPSASYQGPGHPQPNRLGSEHFGVGLAVCAAACTPHQLASGPVANGYRYTVSLRRLDAQNRLCVRVDLPAAAESAVFALPKLVPGIYGRRNFGQYITDMQAFDRRRLALAVVRQDTNSWRITAAQQLHTLPTLIQKAEGVIQINVRVARR